MTDTATETAASAPGSESSTVVAECELPEAPEKVWKALTVPDLLAAWLPAALDCKVLAAERPHRLCYQWREDAAQSPATRADTPKLDSTVTFELTPTENGGTHLRVVHRAVCATLTGSATILPFRRRLQPTSMLLTAWRRAA